MKIVFFGTMPFSSEILSALLRSDHEVVGVVTMPDRPRGRSKRPAPPPVKELLLETRPSIPLFQPERASTPEMVESLSSLNADVFVVVGYGEIIKQALLDVPSKGCINVHTSLLPAYRGAAPIQRAIMKGEKIIGITIMEMVRAMDAGDIYLQEGIEFSDTALVGEVEKLLSILAQKLLLKTLSNIEEGKATKTPQDPEKVTLAPKLSLDDLEIDWEQGALAIHNQVRALSPKPGAFTTVRLRGETKRLKILGSEVVPDKKTAAEIDIDRQIIGCREGSLKLLDVQLEGKKRMSASQFLLGAADLSILK